MSDLINKTKKYLNSKNYTKFDSSLKKLRKSDPKIADELYLMSLMQQGDIAELEVSLDRYLEKYESVPYDNLVTAARLKVEKDQYDAAIKILERAIKLEETNCEAAEVLFVACLNSKQTSRACAVNDLLIEFGGKTPRYLEWRVIAYTQLPDPEKALQAWEDFTELFRVTQLLDYFPTLSCVLRAYASQGRISEIDQLIKNYDLLSQDNIDVRLALAEVDRAKGDVRSWARSLSAISDENPQLTELRWNSSLALLSAGAVSEGLERYEARWEWENFPSPRRTSNIARWNGEGLEGQKLLIWSEQGVGDQLMFLVCLTKVLEKKPEKIVIEIHEKLIPFVNVWYPEIEAVGHGPLHIDKNEEKYSEFDFQIPSGSLPKLFLNTEEKIMNLPRRCLSVSDDKRRELLGQFVDNFDVIIGLCWRSSYVTDARKQYYFSVDGAISIIRDVPKNVGFLVLQYDLQPHEAEKFSKMSNVLICEGNLFDDVLLNGLYAGCCDLVVSAGTANLVVSGIFGRPILTWAEIDSWVYFGRKENPWFNNVSAIRCDINWDIGSLISEIKRRLNVLLT